LENGGDNIFVLVLIAILGSVVISFGIFYFFFAYIQKTAKHRQVLQQKEIEYKTLLFNSVVASQEEERRLIGKELHDEVSSVLYAIRLRLKNNSLPDNHSNIEAIDQIIRITRNISHLLSPPEIEMLGFHDSIKQLVDNFSDNDAQLKINLVDHAEGFISRGKFQVSLMLYRIIQELITNTIKHAHAKNIDITIENINSSLVITYKDDGIGMKAESFNNPTLGVKNILSRLILIKAHYNFKEGDGFHFEIILDHNNIA